MSKQKLPTLFALLAAALYAISAPFSKLLLKELAPTMLAAFLYLGAGIGMALVGLLQKFSGRKKSELRLTKQELPYIIAMILLDIAAPVFLMIGLKRTTAANASLLNNFEIVATTLIALFIFKEAVGKRLWSAILLITLSSVILSFEDMSSFSFSLGSLFVLLACVCWGLENNCTRAISGKDPLQIVVIKGFGSGLGSLLLALAIGEVFAKPQYIAATLLLGFVAYGLSIFFYVYAQRDLGAAKTSAYYALTPFIGVALSLLIFRQMPPLSFFAALTIMIFGTYLASTEPDASKQE